MEDEVGNETKLGLPYPISQCPAISPGLRLGPQPRASFSSLRSAPEVQRWDRGTAKLAARDLLWAPSCRGALRLRQGLGKVSEERARGGGGRQRRSRLREQ